jgi:Zn-dependent peptidase ImmA (M78 family)
MFANCNKADFKKAITKAEEVLRENCLFEPPIIAAEIARNYGLTVKYYKFKPEYSSISGLIEPQISTIIINSADPIQRKNFTIAHELGHHLLGHLGSDREILYRHPIDGQDKKPEEQEADCFAANLLVPCNLLKYYIKEYPFAFNEQLSNEQLAKVFGVSIDVIGYRKLYL